MTNNTAYKSNIISAESMQFAGTTGKSLYATRKHAVDNAVKANVEAWIVANPNSKVDIVENKAVEFKTVELMWCKVDSIIGKVAGFTEVDPGTVGAAFSKNIRVRSSVVSKHCTAQYVEGLAQDVVILRIPGVKQDGSAVPQNEWEQLFYSWLKRNNRVCMWTQSSVKPSGTDKAASFYTVSIEMFNKVFGGMDIREAANYGGLLFSECDARMGLRITMNVGEPVDGHDGNCIVSSAFLPGTMQFRAVEVVNGTVKAVAKGTMTPVVAGGQPEFDTNQVKFGGKGEHTFVVLTNDAVKADRMASKVWASGMVGSNIKWTEETERVSVARVQSEVRGLLSMLKPENRALLARRWGALDFNNFELSTAANSAVDAIRANMPESSEYNDLLGRVAIAEIANGIVPSLGISGFRSLIFQSAEYGQRETGIESAKVAFFGMPVLTGGDIFALPKSAFKSHQGMIVSPEITDAGGRDSDGDGGIEISGDSGKFVLENRVSVPDAIKPAKAKKVGVANQKSMYIEACNLVSSSWIVGAATNAYWRAAQLVNYAEKSDDVEMADAFRSIAGKFAFAAKTAPMVAKHNVSVDGKAFSSWYQEMNTREGQAIKAVKLNWTEMQDKAKNWKALGEFEYIEMPNCLIDVCWNAAVAEVKKFVAENPISAFPGTEISFIATERNGELPFWAMAEAAKAARIWDEYFHSDDRSKTSDAAMRAWAKTWWSEADPEVAAAGMTLRTKSGGNRWGWKKNAFAAKVGTRILGIHPLLSEYVKKNNPDVFESAQFQALVEAK